MSLNAWWVGDPMEVFVRLHNRTYTYDEFKRILAGTGIKEIENLADDPVWVSNFEHTINTLRFPLTIYRGLRVPRSMQPDTSWFRRGGYNYLPEENEEGEIPASWSWTKEIAEYFACGCHEAAGRWSDDEDDLDPWILSMRVLYPSAIEWDSTIWHYAEFSANETYHPWQREDEVHVGDLDAVVDLGAYRLSEKRCLDLCRRKELIDSATAKKWDPLLPAWVQRHIKRR